MDKNQNGKKNFFYKYRLPLTLIYADQLSRMDKPGESEIWNALWGQTDAPDPWFENIDFIEKIFIAFKSISPLKTPILDVGCGRGKFLEYVFSHGGHFGLGTDFAFSSIKSGTIPAIVSNACDLPFSSNTFCSITSILAIEHIPDYDRFFAESFRLLKSEGCLYLIFPNYWSLVTPAMGIKRLFFRGKSEGFYFQTLKRRDVCKYLENTGYRILYVGFFSIANYLSGFERFIGSTLGSILPKKNKEEIIIVCQKA